MIRFRDVRGPALDVAVETLLKKMSQPSGATAATPAAEKPPAAKPDIAKPAAESDAVELRLWTRRDGKTAKMRFVKVEGTKASFMSAAGKTYALPIDSLSDADQKWIREHAN